MSAKRRRAEASTTPQSLGVDSEAEYHGLLVEEGLTDLSVLKSVTLLGRKRGREWSLLRVGLKGRLLPTVIERLQASLRVESGVPFYAHFYRLNQLIVIFPDKVFRLTPEKATWTEVVAYGRSVGIPVEQLDFAPCKFEDETF